MPRSSVLSFNNRISIWIENSAPRFNAVSLSRDQVLNTVREYASQTEDWISMMEERREDELRLEQEKRQCVAEEGNRRKAALQALKPATRKKLERFQRYVEMLIDVMDMSRERAVEKVASKRKFTPVLKYYEAVESASTSPSRGIPSAKR